jgi:hypothetical protein
MNFGVWSEAPNVAAEAGVDGRSALTIRQG